MRRNLTIAMILAVLACLAAPVFAQEAGEGEAYADTWIQPGMGLIGGGANGWAYYGLNSNSVSSTHFGVFGWGGYTLEGGLNLGPYLNVYFDSDSTSTTYGVSLGIQASRYFGAGSFMIFVRSTERIHFWGSAEADFGLTGFSTMADAGLAFPLSDNLFLEAGPELYFYANDSFNYYYLTVGLNLGLTVQF
jgi:hypothetical protein